MTLRSKTLLLVLLTLVALIAILYGVSRFTLLGGFHELEERDTKQNVQRTLSALSYEISSLDTSTHDWAAWDDTYAFIQDADAKYEESNLGDGTFQSLKINLMLFVNNSGGIIFGKAFDLQNKVEIPVSPSLQEHLSSGSVLLYHPDTESFVAGVVLLPEAPLLIASRPILTSEEEGPIRGSLIMGQYLDDSEIQRLSGITHLSLDMHRLDDSQMPPDFQSARSSLLEGSPIAVQALSSESVAGYSLVKDIYGEPILVLKAETPRDVYREGQDTVSWLLLAFWIVGLLFSGVTLLILYRMVLTRLARLSVGVSAVGASGDLSARVSMPGRDELSALANKINEMMAGLQASQRAFRESEESFRSLFTGAPIGIYIVQDGKFRMVNQRFQELSGRAETELLGMSSLDIVHREDRNMVRENAIKMLKGELHSPYVYRYVDQAGETRWVVERVVSIHYQGGRAALGSFMDITERMRGEQALRESQERFRALTETTGDWVWETGIDGTYTYASPRIRELLGYEPEEIVGKTPLDFMPPEEAKRVARGFRSHIESPRPFSGLENINRHKGGRLVVLETNAVPFFASDGRFCGFRGIDRDITERKRLEQQLRDYSENLEKMVEDRTRRLQEAQDKMIRMEKLAAIGEVAGGLAHELRNPLEAIELSVAFLKARLGETADEKVSRHLDLLEKQVDACGKIIADVLDFSRPAKPRFEEVNVNQIVRATIEGSTMPRNVKLVTSLAAGLSPVMADAGQMERVLSNLVTNAIQAMPNGGTLTMSTCWRDRFIEIRVADTGVGIPQENLERIFEPLFTTKARGIGLGLSIVRTLVERHSGAIEVESEVGEGTIFTIKLPLPGKEA